jgi:hypothetical protein
MGHDSGVTKRAMWSAWPGDRPWIKQLFGLDDGMYKDVAAPPCTV